MSYNFRALIRDFVAEGLFFSGLTRPSKCVQGKLTVVTFHRVLPEPLRQQYPYPGICVTPEELRWFCKFFQTYFTVGSHTAIYKRCLAGEQPQKPFLAITFDDGQLDNLQYALPVLKEFDFKATFYIPVTSIDEAKLLWHDRIGYCARMAKNQGEATMLKTLELANSYGIPVSLNRPFEQHLVEEAKLISTEARLQLVQAIEAMLKSPSPEWGRMMTWDEIRQVQQAGHEIGSHSMTHALMPQCNADALKFEIGESKHKLEKELGAEILSFCYPNGDFDDRSMLAVRDAGYHNAVTTLWGKNQAGADSFALKRCDVNTFNNLNRKRALSNARFAFRLSGLQPNV